VELRRGIGYVIQQAGLFPHMTIGENIATVPRLLGWSKQRARDRAAELMERVGLDPAMARRYPYQLSGGQQQRVGVARALAADPPILLMDEPFSAVDPIVRDQLQDEFLRLQGELGKTILFVTHDIDESVYLSDRVIVLTHSPTEVKEIVQVGLPVPRDQIATKELAEFTQLRGHVHRLIRRERLEAPVDA
jgi:osmoprotectant transport system ATP-binding protein